MDPYGRGIYSYRDDYPPPRRDPRSFDSYAPSPRVDVQYPRTVDRVYAAAPASVSYPGLPPNRAVEIRYYDPDMGPPVPLSYQPAPAPPVVVPAPPRQIQLPSGSGSGQFVPGQTYRVVAVDETQLYHAAPPPQPRTDYVAHDYGYPSVPRGPPTRRTYYQQY